MLPWRLSLRWVLHPDIQLEGFEAFLFEHAQQVTQKCLLALPAVLLTFMQTSDDYVLRTGKRLALQ